MPIRLPKSKSGLLNACQMYNLGVRRLVGLETEYGFTVEGLPVSQLMEASAEIVRSCPLDGVRKWNYSLEDPRRDMRGFRADRLQTDPNDDRFEQSSTVRAFGQQAVADRVLSNGGRLYNDHGHPEYATPETVGLLSLVAADLAGEQIVQQCAQTYSKNVGAEVRVYKNNTDYHGASYGCHESYLCRRDVEFDRLLAGLIPFLSTRQIFTGAGKAIIEGERRPKAAFQISQRADFISEIASVDTLYRRPIFNTRDEPHADAAQYRRLHVICGDANRSHWATAMKVGTTRIALDLIEHGWQPKIEIRDPVRAIKEISRDQQFAWTVELSNGQKIRATDVQRAYLSEAAKLLEGQDKETDWVMAEWERCLDLLDDDPMRLSDRADWAAKLGLLRLYMDSDGVELSDPMIAALDMEYHLLNPTESLYQALVDQGQLLALISDETAQSSISEAMDATRAKIRGLAVQRFADRIVWISWGRLRLKTDRGERTINLERLVDPDLTKLLETLQGIDDPTAFADAIADALRSQL